jgi:hypothetical protein
LASCTDVWWGHRAFLGVMYRRFNTSFIPIRTATIQKKRNVILSYTLCWNMLCYSITLLSVHISYHIIYHIIILIISCYISYIDHIILYQSYHISII